MTLRRQALSRLATTAARWLAGLSAATADRLLWQGPESGSLPRRSLALASVSLLRSRIDRYLTRRYRALISAAPLPIGAVTTVVISDRCIRAVLVGGGRVRHWGRVELPHGTVVDGEIADTKTFEAELRWLVESLADGIKLAGSRVAVAITGRNVVQSRFEVVLDDDRDLESAIVAAAAQRMSITPRDVSLDWLATLRAPEDHGDEPQPPSYDVYALGLYLNVTERNLGQLARLKAKPVDVRPKPLTLAMAAGGPSALILDLEGDNVSVVVARNGVPELARDLALAEDLPSSSRANAIRSLINLSVGYYDSLNPDSPLGADTPLFVAGDTDSRLNPLTEALAGLPYPRRSFPRSIPASEHFPYDRYAGNVGLALASKLQLWRWPGRDRLPGTALRFLPPSYRPRPFPVRTVLTGLVTAGLILGAGAMFSLYMNGRQNLERHITTAGIVQARVAQRANEIRRAGRIQTEIDALQVVVDRALSETAAIRSIDRGFGASLTAVSALRPQDVVLRTIDDDGGRVIVQAAAGSYDSLIDYARALAEQPGFETVRIQSLYRDSALLPGVAPPLGGPGGTANPAAAVALLEIERGQVP